MIVVEVLFLMWFVVVFVRGGIVDCGKLRESRRMFNVLLRFRHRYHFV